MIRADCNGYAPNIWSNSNLLGICAACGAFIMSMGFENPTFRTKTTPSPCAPCRLALDSFVALQYTQTKVNARTLIEALSFWEASGSAIAQTARETSDVLSVGGIPNLLAGGIAVQLHGYARFTGDVDIIVPDVQVAHELLLSKGFSQSLRKLVAVVHPTLRVTVDLLPGGSYFEPGRLVAFPIPTDTALVMHPVSLEDLISLKLDAWLKYPVQRGQDKVDVEKLIANNRLPRDFNAHPAMTEQYRRIWDAVAAESAANPNLLES